MIQFDPGIALIVDIAVWSIAGVTIGFVHHHVPVERLSRDGPLTRIRRWERGGRWYQRTLRISAWKDLLPEAGAFFRGGVSKRSLPSRDRVGLERFAIETRRAERVHWSLLALCPIFWLWNPPVLAIAMTAYALIANVPFILVQRFNRARLHRILQYRGTLASVSWSRTA